MADKIPNPEIGPPLFSVDPVSLLLSQNCGSHQLRLLVDGFDGFERGPRFGEYTRLREAKLRVKRDFEKILAEEEERFFGRDERRKPAKQVRFGGDFVISPVEEEEEEEQEEEKENRVSPERKNPTRFGVNKVKNSRNSSMLAQSVPDFSAVIRKENRRPTTKPNAPSRNVELTPPPSKNRNSAILGSSSARGSKSASAGEKKRKGMGLGARKSYASVEDLKRISMAAASAINVGERKDARGSRTRQLY